MVPEGKEVELDVPEVVGSKEVSVPVAVAPPPKKRSSAPAIARCPACQAGVEYPGVRHSAECKRAKAASVALPPAEPSPVKSWRPPPLEDFECEPAEAGEVDWEIVNVSEAPAEAGSAAGDAMEVDAQDIPMLDFCLCDRFVSPLRISSSEVIVFERFLVESIGFDAASKSSSELVKLCGVKMRLWKPDWGVTPPWKISLPCIRRSWALMLCRQGSH